MQQIRSLWDCQWARVNVHIYCAKGYPLGPEGIVPLQLAAAGEPLVYDVCEVCEDFEKTGFSLKPDERGWRGGSNA